MLEKADREDTVDKMVQSYSHHRAVEITLTILKKINQNQLAEQLKIKLRKGNAQETQGEIYTIDNVKSLLTCR